jgi:hypothetical protein
MCSIHKKLAVAVALSLSMIVGCQRIVPPPTVSPVNTTPVVVDDAMKYRDWDRSTSYYQNGGTVAGGTAYLWQTHETIPEGWQRYTDVPVSLANIVSMPVGLFVDSPFKPQVYRGEAVPPTYTANPPLP